MKKNTHVVRYVVEFNVEKLIEISETISAEIGRILLQSTIEALDLTKEDVTLHPYHREEFQQFVHIIGDRSDPLFRPANCTCDETKTPAQKQVNLPPSGICILTEADILSGRSDDCTMHEHERALECTCIENTNDESAGHEEYCPRYGLRD